MTRQERLTKLSNLLRTGNKKQRSKAAHELGKIRVSGLSGREMKQWCSNAGKAAWANVSPSERTMEMRRRRSVALLKRAERIQAELAAAKLKKP